MRSEEGDERLRVSVNQNKDWLISSDRSFQIPRPGSNNSAGATIGMMGVGELSSFQLGHDGNGSGRSSKE